MIEDVPRMVQDSNQLSCAQAKPHMLKVQVEWDETSQACRLHRDLIDVDGVMPALVTWPTNRVSRVKRFCVFSTSSKRRYNSA